MPALMIPSRSQLTAAMSSWRGLVAAILVAASCAYVIPVERSIGLFTQANTNANTNNIFFIKNSLF